MNARENIRRYYQSVELPGGSSWNHVQTLKRINNYYLGKFESGEYDAKGYKKFFYNQSKPACDIATKYIDLDTKDVVLISEKPDSEFKVWVMQRDLKQWLKKEKFGVLLNQLAVDYPKYGHVFIKKAGNKWNKVNIENLRFDPSSDSLGTDDFFYEVHVMTIREISKMGWDKDAVQQLYDAGPIHTIYECYDYDGEWKRTIRANIYDRRGADGSIIKGTEALFNNESEDYLPGIVLHEDNADPAEMYRELRFEDIPGRRLGLGFMEYLFDNQISMNELTNVKRKGLYYTSLHIFQTKDETVGRNLLTDAENGDIVKTIDQILPVQTEERNLAVFNQEEQRWDQNTIAKTFTTDISRGENLPSRTPLGVANIQAAQVASYFELKRENFGMFVKSLLLEEVIPSFKKKSRKEHILTFLGSDAERSKLNSAISEYLVLEEAMQYAERTGFFPALEQVEQERQKVMSKLRGERNLYLTIPDSFYENAEYDVDILVTGEQLDTGARSQTLQIVLQILGTNPAILQNKPTRTILFKLLEMGGISPVELNIMGDQMDSEPAQAVPQGGSVSVPSGAGPGQMPVVNRL